MAHFGLFRFGLYDCMSLVGLDEFCWACHGCRSGMSLSLPFDRRPGSRPLRFISVWLVGVLLGSVLYGFVVSRLVV